MAFHRLSSKSQQQSLSYPSLTQSNNLMPSLESYLFSPPTGTSVPLATGVGTARAAQLAGGPSPPQQLDRVPHRLDPYQQAFPTRHPSNPSPSGGSSISHADSSIAPQDTEHSVSGIILTRYQRPPTRISEPSIPQIIDRRSSVKYFDAYCERAHRRFSFCLKRRWRN